MDYNELLKLIALPALGVIGTWATQKLRSKPEKQKEEVSADRAAWELTRDQWGWAKEEIKELRSTVEGQQGKIVSLEGRLAETQNSHNELEAYTHGLVRWIKSVLNVLDNEANGASILAKVGVPLPDLEFTKKEGTK